MASSPVNPNLPELVLADLIYLLSYHPEFVDPTDALLPADVTRDVLDRASAVYNYFLHILQHFLDSVTERTEGNYSLLLAICFTIKNSEDVRDPSNTKIYKLADLVQLAVHKRSENKVWKTSISTGVSLPRSMYQPRREPPKERYLPKGYTLPAGRAEKDGAVHAPSTPRAHGTPRKRKGGDDTPASFGFTSPSTARGSKAAARSPASSSSSGKKAKKAKVERQPKEAATPSRQMPLRNAKAAVGTYNDEELAGHSEDDEEDDDDTLPAHKASRNGGVNGSAGRSTARLTVSVSKQQQQQRQVEEPEEEVGAEEELEEEEGEDAAVTMDEGETAEDGEQEAGEEDVEEEEYVSPVRGKRTPAAAQRAGRATGAASGGRSKKK